jgi:hypothetical protein
MDVNSITAISAVVIALASLVVTLMETRASREHDRQSMRPALQINHVKMHGDLRTGLKVRNVGLGPAVIVSTAVWLDGNPVGSWDRGVFELLAGANRPVPSFGSLYNKSILPAGDERYLLFIEPFRKRRQSWFWELVAYRLALEVKYESLYGGENFIELKSPRPPEQRNWLA